MASAEFILNEYTYTVIAIIILYIFIRLYLNPQSRTNGLNESSVTSTATFSPKITQFTACASESCVRCQKYNQLRIQALSTLKEKFPFSEKENLKRLLSALTEHQFLEVDDQIFDDQKQRPTVLHIKELTAKYWWDPEDFENDVDHIENDFMDILNEYNQILMLLKTDDETTEHGWTKNISETGRWFTFYIYNQGTKVEQNAKKTPVIVSLIENKLKNCMLDCVFGNVFISVMQPGTRIEPHYGPSNVRIRCHLGLSCPPGWFITVNGISKQWHLGKCILFDDSFLHFVNHDMDIGITNLRNAAGNLDNYRAVLIMDFYHPGLTNAEKRAISTIFQAV